MRKADNPRKAAGQSRVGLLIVGGGIMGLWAAVHAERRGIDTLLVDSGRIGHGASGGLLGSLMAHMPDRWSDKKQFQFEALVSLEEAIRTLESQTGIASGYRRTGRLIPLPKEHLRTIAAGHSKDADTNWRAGDRRFGWNVLESSPFGADWPAEETAAAGLVLDTLAARVFPRSMSALLLGYLKTAKRVRIIEGADVRSIDSRHATASLASGRQIAFGHCIVAAGYRSFAMLEALGDPLGAALGQPVKGQAALLKADIDPSWPLLYLDGLYVVPHEGGHVAIGSTSENRFADPHGTDDQLDDLIARARLLAPGLSNAEVIERWAGLRPKAIDRDPMVGPHPDHGRVIALTGGFKVSFGIAHRLAEAAIAAIDGEMPALPASFHLASHLKIAARKT